ncbi:hypothetical protein JNB11_05875 [Kocuria palustris]|nr:hypothetical protein [Kocuria palustris]
MSPPEECGELIRNGKNQRLLATTVYCQKRQKMAGSRLLPGMPMVGDPQPPRR